MMEVLVIKGLSNWKTAALLEKKAYAEAVDNFLVEGFLVALWGDEDEKNVLKNTPVTVTALENWGLTPTFAEFVVAADPEEYFGLHHAISAILRQANFPLENLPKKPAGYPLDLAAGVYSYSIHDLFELANGMEPLHRSAAVDVAFVPSPEEATSCLPVGFPDDHFPVYHACSWFSTLSIANGIEPMANKKESLDFGKGFYCSPSFEYALWWATRYGNANIGSQRAIILFAVPKTYDQQVSVLRLPPESEAWYNIVRHNRKVGSGAPMADIYEGPVCRQASRVSQCTAEPQPSQHPQICFKTHPAVNLLKMVRVFFLKEDRSIAMLE